MAVGQAGAISWRLQVGSAFIPAVPLVLGTLFCPESPRWYFKKGKVDRAWQSLLRLRNTPLQAARDLYYMEKLLQAEREGQVGGWKQMLKDMWVVKRVRRAAMASGLVMFMQQVSRTHCTPTSRR